MTLKDAILFARILLFCAIAVCEVLLRSDSSRMIFFVIVR